MNSALVIAPILPGKFDRWKEMMHLAEEEGLQELGKEGGVDRVRFWHFKTPDGGDMAAVLHEGPAPEKWMPTLMASPLPLAAKFRDMAAEVHGLTPEAMENAPPPPAIMGDLSLN